LAIVAGPLKSRGLTRRATRSVPRCQRRRVLRGFWGLCSSTSGQRTEHALAHSTETVFLRDLVAGFACGYTALNSGHGETPCGGEHLFDSRLNKQTAMESAGSGPNSVRTCCLEAGFAYDTLEASAAHGQSVVLPSDHVTKGLFFCFVSDDELTTSTILLGVSGHLDLNLGWRLSEA
jgi:hypothetical protein